jgi:hypothetical protein
MPVAVIPNCGTLKIQWQGLTRTWLNVFGIVGNPTLPTITQALSDTLATEIRAQFTSTGLAALMATTVSLNTILLRDISVANRPEFTGAGAGVPGTGTGDALPVSLAAVVTLRTAAAGKSFRGRTYLSGFTEGQNDAAGRQAAAVNTASVAFVQAVVGVLTAHGMGMAVLSRPRDPLTIPEKVILGKPGFATVVTALVARNTKWETQRRRTGRS